MHAPHLNLRPKAATGDEKEHLRFIVWYMLSCRFMQWERSGIHVGEKPTTDLNLEGLSQTLKVSLLFLQPWPVRLLQSLQTFP